MRYILLCFFATMAINGCGSSDNSVDGTPVQPNPTPSQGDPLVTRNEGEVAFAGLWNGFLSQQIDSADESIVSTFNYEIELEESENSSFSGIARISILEPSASYAIFEITAESDGENLTITDLNQSESEGTADLPAINCLTSIEFAVVEDRLEGNWTAADCPTGRVYLSRSSPPQRWFEALPDCPCQFDSSLDGTSAQDRLGRAGEWSVFTTALELHPGASTSLRWAGEEVGSGQQCTYDEDGSLITSGLGAGTPDLFSPTLDIFSPLSSAESLYSHFVEDVLTFGANAAGTNTAIDFLSGEDGLGVFTCRVYYDLYPPNNGLACPENARSELLDSARLTCPEMAEIYTEGGSFIPDARPLDTIPVSYTDPHLRTIDGLTYSFQAIGEFILVRSEIDELEIQSRQARYGGLGSQVSVNTGFGFNVNGHHVSIVKSSSGDTALFIDDVETSGVGDIELASGGLVSVDPASFQLTWPDGSIAVVADRGSFFNLSLALSAEHEGRVSGLLGNFDSVADNDMATSSGEDLTSQPSANELYGVFADGWRINDEASLLYYYDGQNTEFFTDRLFPGRAVTINDLDNATRITAEQICTAAGITNEVLLEDCIIDVGFSGDASFADAIHELQVLVTGELVEVNVQGELDVPKLACDTSQQDSSLAGTYVGTMTNPDVNVTWNTELMVGHCDEIVVGVNKNSFGDAFANRRFEGTWNGSDITIRLGPPYSADFTPVTSINRACENMTSRLVRAGDTLTGTWESTTPGCGQGGSINIVKIPADFNESVYLNIENMDITQGENSTPSLNNTVSLNNVIDAANADSVESHSQSTHVWHTGPLLELIFDFRREYVLQTVHFWNYFEESYDVDAIELSFSDDSNTVLGSISLTPSLGDGNATASEDFDIDLGLSVRYVRAVITGSNGQSDFLNMGFTANEP